MNQQLQGISRRELLKRGLLSGSAVVLGSNALAPTIARAGEEFPISPLILEPFIDPLPIPTDLLPSNPATWTTPTGAPLPVDPNHNGEGPHQIWTPPSAYYRIPILFRPHRFTSSLVQGPQGPVHLPDSWMSLFGGTFPGPLIRAWYGQPALVRFENLLDKNDHPQGRWGDFGVPSTLTHLHNAHTACESDGNPFDTHGHGFDSWHIQGNGKWYCDNLYLNSAPDNDERENQSFLWFHDHRMDETGSNVAKGLVGLYYLHDRLDANDETRGFRLPSGQYDIPLALYDCLLDDGVARHRGINTEVGQHFGVLQDGEAHPENWGQLFYAHYENSGFVGDVFTVNGKVMPYLPVKRRKYRLRFLDCSVARWYELKLMAGTPQLAPGVQGQWVLQGGQQVMRFIHIAGDGGLVPAPFVRDSFQIAPAKRREMIVDFSRYQDGTPTTAGDAIYLTNILQMTEGRKPEGPQVPGVPLLKFIIDGNQPAVDYSVIPRKLRPLPPLPPRSVLNSLPRREWRMDRSGGHWTINGEPFDHHKSYADIPRGSAEVWIISNGGGGWVHPVHIHQEEHQVLSRDGRRPAPEDYCKEDVVALAEGEEVHIYRKFRTFTGPYVAHCHNLAHEDHAMMFGWTII
ncbi:MAG: multicopper oxidase domain-containing protein [Thermoguttaceae bacterium]|jgi:FtsP/CotA-like multicopper oxidase with cupredoxin domain|nr:multicopper oxidase domain-containing protein [Thermoguttaceae bacterium]